MRAFVVAAALLAASASAVSAFDGQRGGFMLGGGVGASFVSYDLKVFVFDEGINIGRPVERREKDSKFGFATDFRIGGGINDNLIVMYANRTAFFDALTESGETLTIAASTGGPGFMYFQRELPPSLYYLGVIGLCTWWAPSQNIDTTWSGFGLMGGVGYEFYKHVTAEFTISYNKPGTEQNEVSAWSFLLTVAGIAY